MHGKEIKKKNLKLKNLKIKKKRGGGGESAVPGGLDGTQEAAWQEERWGWTGASGTKGPLPMTLR